MGDATGYGVPRYCKLHRPGKLKFIVLEVNAAVFLTSKVAGATKLTTTLFIVQIHLTIIRIQKR